jgi:hypothetical protein
LARTQLTGIALLSFHQAVSLAVKIALFGNDSVNDGVLGEWVSNAVTQKVDFALAKLQNHRASLLFSRQLTKIFAVSKVTLSSPLLLMIFSPSQGAKPVFRLYSCTLSFIYFISFTSYNLLIQGELR